MKKIILLLLMSACVFVSFSQEVGVTIKYNYYDASLQSYNITMKNVSGNDLTVDVTLPVCEKKIANVLDTFLVNVDTSLNLPNGATKTLFIKKSFCCGDIVVKITGKTYVLIRIPSCDVLPLRFSSPPIAKRSSDGKYIDVTFFVEESIGVNKYVLKTSIDGVTFFEKAIIIPESKNGGTYTAKIKL